jgi:hypothetical protein
MSLTTDMKPLLRMMGESAARLEKAGMQREMVAMAAGRGALAALMLEFDRREAREK